MKQIGATLNKTQTLILTLSYRRFNKLFNDNSFVNLGIASSESTISLNFLYNILHGYLSSQNQFYRQHVPFVVMGRLSCTALYSC